MKFIRNIIYRHLFSRIHIFIGSSGYLNKHIDSLHLSNIMGNSGISWNIEFDLTNNKYSRFI